MTSLYENLPALEAAAQETGPMLDRLLRHGEQTARAATALLEEIAERRAEIDAIEREMAAALDGLAVAATSGQARLEHGVEEVASASDALQTELHGTEDEVGSAASSAGQSVDALGTGMATAGEGAEQEEDRTAEAVAQLDESLRESEEALQGAVAGACASAEALEEAAVQAREAVERSGTRLQEQLKDLAARAHERMGQTVAHIGTTCGAHVAFIEQQGDALEGHVHNLMEEFSERATADLEELGQASVPTLEALAHLGGELAAAGGTVAGEKEAISESYAVLSGKVDPLLAGVGAVREAASRLGLSWP